VSTSGFRFSRQGDEVVITHNGRVAATLRGRAAARFRDDLGGADSQAKKSRATGNYKRGNERQARNHPRNA
jgi:hypothetical protein